MNNQQLVTQLMSLQNSMKTDSLRITAGKLTAVIADKYLDPKKQPNPMSVVNIYKGVYNSIKNIN